jgi:3-methyladenine DNA glycosylase/8-oxoguanine DNA glycosylase
MHWILSTTDRYSLRQTIKQSSWILHAPFRSTHTGDQLLRIERITSKKIVAVVIAQNNRNLVIHTSSNLSGSEIEELTKRARRMLRLGEDFKPFYNLIGDKPLSSGRYQINPTFLRGATLFEDVIRAASLVWYPEGFVNAERYTWLVDHFGDPLPSNPTLHAFPSPSQILQDHQSISSELHPELGNTILHVADIFETQVHEISDILDKCIPSEELSMKLKNLLQLDETPLSHVMLSLGRYDFIPNDPVAREHWLRIWNTEDTPPLDMVDHFETWQPWGGLAYWLWHYSPVATPTRLINQ